MRLIAIDTSTDYFSLGISEDDQVLFSKSFLLYRKHSTELLPILEETLKKLRLSIREIDGFIVGQGPGSFTGLRVGISMVKGMAVSLQRPIVALSTLECLAQGAPPGSGSVAPWMDAKRSQIYAALYYKKNGAFREQWHEDVVTPDAFLKRVKGKTLFVGEGASLYREVIQSHLGKDAIFAHSRYNIPDPKVLLRVGGERFAKKRFESPYTLTPLYLYPKDCMIKK